MNFDETIKSWRWRIVKANHSIQSFSELVNLFPSQMTTYFSGKVRPSIGIFERIENKLRELGV